MPPTAMRYGVVVLSLLAPLIAFARPGPSPAPPPSNDVRNGAGDESKDKKTDRQQNLGRREGERMREREVQQTPAEAARLPEAQQQELVRAERARAAAYDQRVQHQARALAEGAVALSQANRRAQARYHAQYAAGLRAQHDRLRRNDHSDAYSRTAASWRYTRDGQSHEVNQYAADALRHAVDEGYDQGVRAGDADREDRWSHSHFQDSQAYQDGSYGYDGAYVDLDEYQHYFREGFQRGYADGASNQFRFGARREGRATLLGSILGSILNLHALR